MGRTLANGRLGTEAPVSDSVRLRPWQHAALEAFVGRGQPDFLAVATPGAGKTTYALVAARMALARRPAPLLVVTPTAHLKTQWATAAARLQLHLDPGWAAAEGGLPADMHGVVTTYQQVALHPAAVRRLASGAFVILDEVHHGGEERAWGAALQHAFSVAHRRLSLSGTPFRSDTRAIPFVRYHGDDAIPDFEYGYGDALHDGGVVRPVAYPDGRLQCALVEIDMGTLTLRRFARKVLAFETALARDVFYKHFKRDEFQVFVLTQSERRLEALRQAAEPVVHNSRWTDYLFATF